MANGPREQAYDEHISPLMTRIIDLCKEHGINMVAQFELDFDEELDSPLFCTTCIAPESACGTLRRLAHLARYGEPAGVVAMTIGGRS